MRRQARTHGLRLVRACQAMKHRRLQRAASGAMRTPRGRRALRHRHARKVRVQSERAPARPRQRDRPRAAALLRILLSTKFEFDLPLKSSAATAPPTEDEYEFDPRATSTDNGSAARPMTPSFFSRDWFARHSDTALRSLGKIVGVVFFFYAPSVATAFPTKEFELRTLAASNGHIEGGHHIDPSGFGLLRGHATQRHRPASPGKRLTKKLGCRFFRTYFL